MIVRDITERSVWSPSPSEAIPNPLFSILLSVEKWATADLLTNAIESVLSNKNVEIELLIIDDSQSSEIETLIEQIVSDDSRVRYVRHPRSIGIKAIGLLEGMRAARGDYFLFLNSTGTLSPTFIDELKAQLDCKRFLVGCGKVRFRSQQVDGQPTEQLGGNDGLSQVYLKSVDFLPETGLILHKSVPQSIGYIDPHFVLANCAVLDYWKRLSRSYEIKRLDLTIGSESLAETSNKSEFGTLPDSVLYREWCKISRNQLLSNETIDHYNIRVKRRVSMIAELELSQLEEVAEEQWWHHGENLEIEPQTPFMASNNRHGKILIVGHDITASTTMPFGHFEDEFFHPMRFCHLDLEDLTTTQAIILSRSLFEPESQRVINASRSLDVPIYYYFDDNFEILGRTHSAYSAYTTPRIRAQLKDFQGILVPNKALFDYCVDNRWHSNVMLFPPTIATRQWHDTPSLPTKTPGHLRVVFLGGSHRSSDFKKFVLPAIVSANKLYPIELVVVGDHKLEQKDLDGVSVHTLPYEVSYDLMISRLSNSGIDVIVHAGSHSDNNPFKTPNALMNAWELGAVAVVSNEAPYLHVEDLGIALVAKADSIESWREKLLTAATDSKAVNSIKNKLKEHLKAEYSGIANTETIQRMHANLRPLSYPTVQKRYHKLLDSSISQSHQAHTVPSPQQRPRTNIREDVLHKGFTRLYTEIFYRITPDQDNWSGIMFRIGTFNQQAFGELKIRIYDESNREQIVNKTINLLEIADNQLIELNFEPIISSNNRSFCIRFSRERRRDMPRIAIYEEVERESAFRRILRRRGILRYGRKLACKMTYAHKLEERLKTVGLSS